MRNLFNDFMMMIAVFSTIFMYGTLNLYGVNWGIITWWLVISIGSILMVNFNGTEDEEAGF